ncbi:DUF4082 domain-containing protein [Saccharothrix syringae]|uniref:DUF4082 domain-containing protein n=1 Tax=Saccharothrix syringae TaxID=103733 RepID=A0A5Q0H0R0_SACSY|nr:DUF4082 domain-containing protein [Saccharothrix syringae]QFZ19768.1 DUF4082 domain-containing protein [Saccharothrix syringae]
MPSAESARRPARLLALAVAVPALLLAPFAHTSAGAAAPTGTSPVDGAGSVALTPVVGAAFGVALTEPPVAFTLTGPAGPVAGQVSLADGGTTARFTPSAPLSPATAYTASVQADAASAPHTWAFTTGAPRGTDCPCTIWDDFATPAVAAAADSGAVELGAKVYFTSRGEVLGVRFHKGAGNTGTHTGSFWTATGQLLATGTFTDETTTGWQTLFFANPVVVDVDTTYVVSYFAPRGRYAVDEGYFGVPRRPVGYGHVQAVPDSATDPNGVFRYGGGMPFSGFRGSNYWVDVIYRHGTNGDHTRPVLDTRSPAPAATGVGLDGTLTLGFDEAVDPASSRVRLADDGQGGLSGTATPSADGRTVTWTPSAPLKPGTRYTATVLAVDVNGNAMASAATWSFTTGPQAACPCSLFSEANVPDEPSTGQRVPVELGVRFGTSEPGSVTGVRFYKGAGNTGTHTGSLWTDQGVLLATGTFTGETATGWQTLTFDTPAPVSADQVYVASYYSPTGQYAVNRNYFGLRGQFASPPLWTAPGAYANGRYRSGAGFPDSHYIGSNYWVDVVFAAD